MCTFCDQVTETTQHLFVECEIIKKLWKSLARWINYMFGIDIVFSPELIIFNDYQGLQKEYVKHIYFDL